jgi:hypothetical protein
MDTTIAIIAALIIVAIVALVAYWLLSQRRSAALKERFGPEYERTVSETGKRSEAERELQDRTRRVEKLHLRDLSESDRSRFAEQWRGVQVRFVDDPESTIKEADNLVQQVMDARGYPITDFERQAADISVDHPDVVTNYRAAHSIAEKHATDGVSTEDLRQAFVHYRSLFNELLGNVAVTR